jgi:hypothetical protein
VDALSNERTCPSFTTAVSPRQHSHSRVLLPRDSGPYFTVSYSRLPKPRRPGPRIYIPQEQGGPSFTTQALGSFSVASYGSQGYGGDIRTHLHTGIRWRHCYERLRNKSGRTEEKTLTVTPRRQRRRPLLCNSGKHVTAIARQVPLYYW